jgi:hypothetical protein
MPSIFLSGHSSVFSFGLVFTVGSLVLVLEVGQPHARLSGLLGERLQLPEYRVIRPHQVGHDLHEPEDVGEQDGQFRLGEQLLAKCLSVLVEDPFEPPVTLRSLVFVIR